jgi:hypothetical protein
MKNVLDCTDCKGYNECKVVDIEAAEQAGACVDFDEVDEQTPEEAYQEYYDDQDRHDQEKLDFYLEEYPDYYQGAMDQNLDSIENTGCDTLEELAEQLVEDGIFGDVSNQLSTYIDYEQLGEDLRGDGYTETASGVFRWR